MPDPIPMIRPEVVELAESLLARVRAGAVVALAIVEAHRDGRVDIWAAAGDHYHDLNSGAARLAHRLAGQPGDHEQ
jgi:hypothetical protein